MILGDLDAARLLGIDLCMLWNYEKNVFSSSLSLSIISNNSWNNKKKLQIVDT